MPALRAPSPLALRDPAGGATLAPVSDNLWRVVAPSGRILGHVGARGDGSARRYTALRYHPAERRFRELGSFWNAGEAVDCLRWSR